MKVSFENPDKINGLMTLVVEEADYKNVRRLMFQVSVLVRLLWV